MDCEKARKDVKEYMKTKKFKEFVLKVETQLGRKMSRIEKELTAIDCMECIAINTGKVDDLKRYGIEVTP